MARNKKKSKLTSAAQLAFAPVTYTQRLREMINAAVLPAALAIGALGMVALIGCGILTLIPAERWPVPITPDQLPVVASISLVCASLIGWGCMQRGLASMRETVGWTIGGWIFVLLPICCAGIVLAANHGHLEPRTWPGAPWTLRFLHAYPAVLVVLSLAVYLGGQWRRAKGEDRGVRRAGAVALVLPYAALLATLVFGMESPLISDSLSNALESLGEGAVVLQLALAFFLSPAASSG